MKNKTLIAAMLFDNMTTANKALTRANADAAIAIAEYICRESGDDPEADVFDKLLDKLGLALHGG